MNNFNYYLTNRNEEDLKNGKTLYLWEEFEEDSFRNVYTDNPHFAKVWFSVEDIKKDIDFSNRYFKDLKCVAFEGKKFVKFVSLDP